MDVQKFFAELKRRNVYKVGAVYAVSAWLLIQAASILFPTFEAPGWVMKVFVTVIAAGFPIALILAWAFELTPEGLKRTEFAGEFPKKPGRRRAWIYVVITAGAISVGLFFVGRLTAPTKRSGSAVLPVKSIAVLPFENLSRDPENAYFADGIQEEILTRLAKIADLKVISRTSTQQYQSKPGNLSEIAKQLGVANILEGSVQKAADQVRVNVQLINAQNDSHLWADTYDRKLMDVFGVESEIAKSIAESLQAKLTGREEQALAVKPTSNPEAYDAYLRGLASEAQWLHSVYAMETAVGFYEQAVQLDPAFALAWSRLSRAHSDLYSLPNDPTSNRREAAKRALDMAQKLQPNSPETLLALADYQFVVLRDYELAKTTYRLVSTMLPGSSEVPASLAAIARRQGHWDETNAYYEQALLLDPRNTLLLVDAAWNDSDHRNFKGALKLYDRALDILPNDPDLMAQKASIYQGEGNLEEAAKLLREVNAQTPSLIAFSIKIIQLTLERNLSEALRLLRARVAQFQFGSELEKGVFTASLALTQRLAGDSAGAKITAEQARNTLEPLCRDQPDNDFAAVWLSRACAVLGDKNSALNEAQRAIALRPSAYSAASAPGNEENLALIRAIIGENSGAISTLARLLDVPYQTTIYSTPITAALLRLDPTWDPLRTDPTFQKLCEEKRR
jgi:TolB-like protein/Tfp pilus assembly protein PilF